MPSSFSPPSRFNRLQPFVIALTPFLFFLAHAALFGDWLIDDAGISFAYARNFIHGHGLVSQPGVAPVEGFSCPTWTLLISPFFMGDPPHPALVIKIFSCFWIFLCFLTVTKTCFLLFPQKWLAGWTAFSALTILSFNTSFVVWTISGLENPLYAALCSLYVFFSVAYATGPEKKGRMSALSCGIICALMALTRPEGILFALAFPVIAGISFLRNSGPWKIIVKNTCLFGGSLMSPLFIYMLFRWVYFKDIMPNTFYAKGGPSFAAALHLLSPPWQSMQATFTLFSAAFSWMAGLIMIFLTGMCFHLLFFRTKSSKTILLIPFVGVSWAVFCLLPPDWMGEFRFANLFYLLMPLLFFTCVAELFSDSFNQRFWQKALLSGVTLLVAIQSLMTYSPRSGRFSTQPTVPFKVIARRYAVKFNDYADRLNTGATTFLCPDLGGALYFSRHRIYDLGGLCDKTIARCFRRRDYAAVADYILDDLQPIFIHMHEVWSVKSGLFYDERFRERYAVLTETKSEWAAKFGYDEVCDGDYVLKSALAEPMLQRVLAGDFSAIPIRQTLDGCKPFPYSPTAAP
ncbi:MAG: hypothetical protein RRC34_10850 [Lentisphaeria bacterium]|nr:hypothetical protein [Lentisphaeria bacterium]